MARSRGTGPKNLPKRSPVAAKRVPRPKPKSVQRPKVRPGGAAPARPSFGGGKRSGGFQSSLIHSPKTRATSKGTTTKRMPAPKKSAAKSKI